MKKYASIFICLILTMSFTSCSGAKPSQEKMRAEYTSFLIDSFPLGNETVAIEITEFVVNDSITERDSHYVEATASLTITYLQDNEPLIVLNSFDLEIYYTKHFSGWRFEIASIPNMSFTDKIYKEIMPRFYGNIGSGSSSICPSDFSLVIKSGSILGSYKYLQHDYPIAECYLNRIEYNPASASQKTNVHMDELYNNTYIVADWDIAIIYSEYQDDAIFVYEYYFEYEYYFIHLVGSLYDASNWVLIVFDHDSGTTDSGKIYTKYDNYFIGRNAGAHTG
jgi:hypothetical protein